MDEYLAAGDIGRGDTYSYYLKARYDFEVYRANPDLWYEDDALATFTGDKAAGMRMADAQAYASYYLNGKTSSMPMAVFSDEEQAQMQFAGGWADLSGPVTGAAMGVFPGMTIKGPNNQIIYQGDMDLQPTLTRIANGIKDSHHHDGTIFKNLGDPLPVQPFGYYREYVVRTPSYSQVGPQRLIIGQGGEVYYTPDHYVNFYPVAP